MIVAEVESDKESVWLMQFVPFNADDLMTHTEQELIAFE